MGNAQAKSAERVRAEKVATITGYTVRQIQNLASQGRIPSACKLGKIWTFDELRVRRWQKANEDAIARRKVTSTNEAIPTMRASKSTVTIDESAYEQALKPSRSRSSAGF